MKHKLKLVFLAIIAITVTVIYSCKKDELTKPETVLSKENSNLLEKIRSYQSDMESTLKANDNSADMNIEEVVMLTEATFNAKYAWAEKEYERFSTSKIEIEIDIKHGNKVNLGQRVKAYNMLYKAVKEQYEAIVDIEKHLHLVDVELGEVNSTRAKLLITSVIAINKTQTYGDTEWWYWGMEKGKCGDYDGQQVGKDAAYKLDYSTVQALKPNIQTGAFFYSDFTTVYLGELETWVKYPPYPYDIFYSHDDGNNNPNVDYPCISPTEMNWYHDRIIVRINEVTATTSKLYTGHEVYDAYTIYVGQGGGGWVNKYHVVKIRYGVKTQYTFGGPFDRDGVFYQCC